VSDIQETIKPAFLRGYFTEAIDLSFPDDASFDELNMDIDSRGFRERRPGLQQESTAPLFSVNPITIERRKGNSSFVWRSVGGIGSSNFYVHQFGETLYFIDLNNKPLSAGYFSSVVNLTSFYTVAAETARNQPVQFTAIKGYLFVVSKYMDPIFVEYDAASQTFSSTKLFLKIRDLEGLLETTAVDNRPLSINNIHEYNLGNQGWKTKDTKHRSTGTLRTPLEHWINNNDVLTTGYPSNADVWWTFKDTQVPGVLNFDLNSDDRGFNYAGNSPSPKGYYLLDPFESDRSAVSGISGISISPNTLLRPTTVANYSGRVWYGGVEKTSLNDSIFFSQIIRQDNPELASRCYQRNDPSSEELNQILDNDGGVIEVSGAGRVRKLFPLATGLLVFASNGIWFITGPDGVFRPTDFSVIKISSEHFYSPASVVEVSGTPYWWAGNDIFTISIDSIVGSTPSVTSLTKDTINSFYSAIIPSSKETAIGAYDPFSNRILWLYRAADEPITTDTYVFTKCLVYDLSLQAFLPWQLSSREPELPDSYSITGLFALPELTNLNNNSSLRDRFVLFGHTNPEGNWAFHPYTFQDTTTWQDPGISFKSYLESGPITSENILDRMTPLYLHTMFNAQNNSSCLLSTRWDYSTSATSGKFGTQFQTYRGATNNKSQIISRHKVKGYGRAVRLRFEAEDGKNFQLTGWSLIVNSNTQNSGPRRRRQV